MCVKTHFVSKQLTIQASYSQCFDVVQSLKSATPPLLGVTKTEATPPSMKLIDTEATPLSLD